MTSSLSDDAVKTLVLRDELQALWRDKDIFAEVQQLQGDIARSVPGRETLRFELAGNMYYRKLHTGVGWTEIFKNLLQFRLPIIGAKNEWLALNRLAELGIPSLIPLAYGEKYHNPAKRLSFIVTRELAGTIELDKYLLSRKGFLSFAEKLVLLREVARIAHAIHTHGINHRDLYLCHFLLDLQSMSAWRNGDGKPLLHLVDLHRAHVRDKVPVRWLVKDLASIYFSAMESGLTRGDVYRFLKIYFSQPLSQILLERGSLLRRVTRRAHKLYQRERRLKARGLRD